MKKLRTAVIGLGVGEKHLETFLNHPDCVPVVICDNNPEKARSTSERYPELDIVETDDAVFSRKDIDLISIASYDDAHYRQICCAIEQGTHIFVEKPVCMRHEELLHIRDLLDANQDIRLSSNLILRMSPRFRELKEKIDQDQLGRLFYLEGDYNYGRLHKITEGWRGRIPYYSVLLGGAIHVLDLILWFHPSKVKEVNCYGNRIATEDTTFKFNDLAVALLKFDDGAIAKISANFACVYPHFHKINVYGTKATFENDFGPALLWFSSNTNVAPQLIESDYPGTHKGDLLADFVDSIVTGSKPEVSEEDVFRTMSVCLAMEESLLQQKPVTVNHVNLNRKKDTQTKSIEIN